MAETLEQRIERLAGVQAQKQAAPFETPEQISAVEEFGGAVGDPLSANLRTFGKGTGIIEEERMKGSGVDMSGAPWFPRLMSSLPADAQDQFVALERELTKELGGPVKLRWDEKANALVYDTFDMTGERQSTTIVDEPGASLADVADVAGEVPTILGEAGALASSFLLSKLPFGKSATAIPSKLRQLGRWVRHTIAGAGGAYGGEQGRVRGAAELGQYEGKSPDFIDKEAAEEGFKSGVLSAGATTVVAAGSALFKTVANLVKGRSLPAEYLEWAADLAKNGKNPQGLVDDINNFLEAQGRPERLKLSSGEVLENPELLSKEARLLDDPTLGGREAMIGLREEQADALTAALTAARTEVSDVVPVGPLETGRLIAAPFEALLGDQEREAAGSVATAAEKLVASQRAIENQAGRPPEELGDDLIRDVVGNETKLFKEWANSTDAYGGIRTEAGNLRGPASELKAEVMRQGKLFDQDLAPNLTVENRQTIEGIKGTFDEIEKSGGRVSIDQLDRLISQIRTVQRVADSGQMGTVDSAALQQLKQAAVESRRTLTNQKPGLTEKLAQVEADYAIKKTELERGIVGGIMKKVQGEYRVPSEKVFNKVFQKNGETPARQFMNILQRPGYASELRDFQKSILRKYSDEVAPKPSYKVNPEAHDKFMRDYGSVLDVYFKGDLAPFNSGTTAIGALRTAEAAEKEVAARLNGLFEQSIRKWPADTITAKLWSAPGTTEAVKEALETAGQGDVWKAVQAHFLERIEKSVLTKHIPGSKQRLPSWTALDNLLLDKTGQYRERIRAVGGDQYLGNLEMIRDAALAAQKGDEFRNWSKSGTASNNWWTSVIGKAVQLKVGPLNRTSRLIGRAMGLRSDIEKKAAARVTLDPVELQRVAKEMRTSDPAKWAQQSIGNAIVALLAADSPEDAVRPNAAERLKTTLTPIAKKQLSRVTSQ